MREILARQNDVQRRRQLTEIAFFSGLFVAAAAIIYIFVTHQRHEDIDEFNAHLIAVNKQTLDHVSFEVGRLEQSNREIRAIIEPLRGLSKSVQTLKDISQ